eukprot:11834765-Karenia_brevis.AAC.1
MPPRGGYVTWTLGGTAVCGSAGTSGWQRNGRRGSGLCDARATDVFQRWSGERDLFVGWHARENDVGPE